MNETHTKSPGPLSPGGEADKQTDTENLEAGRQGLFTGGPVGCGITKQEHPCPPAPGRVRGAFPRMSSRIET